MRARRNTGHPALGLVVLATACLVGLTYGQLPRDSSGVEVRWGIADTAATVGRLFRMHVPGDAFSGDVKSYTIKSYDGAPLPSWLHFNEDENVLEGLPTPKDAGQMFLELFAHAAEPKQQASVTFTLLVRDVASHTSGAPLRFRQSSPGPEHVRCKRSEPETVATLVLDIDMDALGVKERVSLLKRFLGHMGLHEEMVKLLPVAGRPMQDGSALVSGVGDTPHATPQTGGTFVSWPVGCGQVKEGHFPALQRLDDDSGSGRMARVLDCPVIGWHVTNSHLQVPKRKRRAVRYQTATPVVTPVMPTKTMTDDEGGAVEKMTHTVVERVSPTFIQPTATQPPTGKTDEPKMPDTPEPPVIVTKPTPPTKVTPPMPPKKKSEEVIEPTKTMDTTSKPTDVVVPPAGGCTSGETPKVMKPLKLKPYKVGEVIDFVIPEETFEDCESGGTRGLQLNLFIDKLTAIPRDSFFKFDKEKQRFFGMPSSENVGSYKLNLVAKKDGSENLNNNMMFDLTIQPLVGAALKKINHNMAVTVDYDYDTFMESVEDRMQLSTNIASLFGDPDASNIQVNKIEPGSVIFSWSNNSLNSGGCPTGEISGLVSKMIGADGKLTEEAKAKMEPFTLTSIESQPAGNCENNPAFPVVKSLPRTDLPKPGDKSTMKPGKDDTTKTDDKTTKGSADDDDEDIAKGSTGDSGDDDGGNDKLLTTVIPAVVIVVVLLIALLVACLLYRRKRKGKMNVEEKNTFINKHPPVIFPDELEDKPSGEAKKPLLLADNGGNTSAAGPPPEYVRGASESPERPTNNGGAAPPTLNGHHDDDDDITEMPERPYDPPPPLTGSGGSAKSPRPAQQPFSQPPQILP